MKHARNLGPDCRGLDALLLVGGGIVGPDGADLEAELWKEFDDGVGYRVTIGHCVTPDETLSRIPRIQGRIDGVGNGLDRPRI
jgi:hypothetical protein